MARRHALHATGGQKVGHGVGDDDVGGRVGPGVAHGDDVGQVIAREHRARGGLAGNQVGRGGGGGHAPAGAAVPGVAGGVGGAGAAERHAGFDRERVGRARHRTAASANREIRRT